MRKRQILMVLCTLTGLIMLAMVVLCMVAVWTGDDRWGTTAFILLIPGLPLFMASLIVTVEM